MNPNVLITGASGFVGRHVINLLKKRNVSVKLVLRPSHDVPSCIGGDDKVIFSSDIFNETQKWWENILEDVDIVLHIAWYTEHEKYLHSEKNLTCLIGTITMAKACLLSNVRRFVGIGTCFEYDVSYGKLSTKTPLLPNTLYAACKVSAYMTLSQLLSNNKIKFAWCRLFYLYGEGEDSRRFIPYLRACLEAGKVAELTQGNQIRDYQDVKEAAIKIVKIGLGESDGVFNICSGIPISVRSFAEKIADEYGRRDLLRFGVRPENLFDPPSVQCLKDV